MFHLFDKQEINLQQQSNTDPSQKVEVHAIAVHMAKSIFNSLQNVRLAACFLEEVP